MEKRGDLSPGILQHLRVQGKKGPAKETGEV